ncbi:MAG: hypothetical protein ABJH48_11770, partial [Parasphingorhabdus sp.]
MAQKSQMTGATSAKDRVSQPLIIKIGKKLRNSANRISSSQSLIPTTPLQQPDIFDWTDRLKDSWADIAREASEILDHRDAVPPLKDISPDHARIAGDGNCKSFFLGGSG